MANQIEMFDKPKPPNRGNELKGLSLYERFQRQYEVCPDTGCWLWTGCVANQGYGRLKKHKRWASAHRVSYELHIGRIPKGLHVLHRCDVPTCVNPDHLWADTNAANIRDKVAKGRSLSGTSNPCAKLSELDVIAIRYELPRAGFYVQDIADEFGISKSTVVRIRMRQLWKDV